MNRLSETLENILEFIDGCINKTIEEKILIRNGFTKRDITILRSSGYIKLDWPKVPYPPRNIKTISLTQKSIDYLTKRGGKIMLKKILRKNGNIQEEIMFEDLKNGDVFEADGLLCEATSDPFTDDDGKLRISVHASNNVLSYLERERRK